MILAITGGTGFVGSHLIDHALETGHTIRAVSFHLPNHLHNRRTGGPNYANRAGVQAMWRMASRIRDIGNDARPAHQFVAMCDCNVTENRDTTDDLVKGRITGPLGLETNYTGRAGGSGSGRELLWNSGRPGCTL